MDAVAERILADPRFQEIDRHFARLIAGLDPAADEVLPVAAALVSRARAEGHICLDLEAAAGELAAAWPEAAAWGGGDAWARRLAACRPVGGPGEWTPLVMDNGRLYLHRYWRHERALAERLLALAGEPPAEAEDPRLGERLRRFFPPAGMSPDWQRVAAYVAATRRLCVISGGPGTGKTATAARILALLLEQRPERIVALAAPTGKAAARMNEAIRSVLAGLDVAAQVRERALARPAQTIHRLLGARRRGAAFAHGAADPIPCDVLVVDEASMVDVALMARLLEALPAGARLVLLGDKNQLASVEAGAFLGDLCAAPAENRFRSALAQGYADATGDGGLAGGHADPAARPLQDCLVQLRHSYRFAADGGIGALCHAVNAGASWSAFEPLFAAHAEIRWRTPPPHRDLAAALAPAIIDGFAPCAAAADPLAALEALGRFRILCVVREGPFGAAALNRLAEEVLAGRGLIRPAGGWYAHRPVMVTVNDYNLRLFNGDIGIARHDADGALRVFFPPEGEGAPRRFLPAMLPAHETVYAMTVHKSQGSEFDRVLLVLPDRDSPVLTRELVYTAVTRARREVTILATPVVFAAAASARVRRTSGLRERLWGMVNSEQ
ncbi:MAG: exodeoxyribonuclease V subunit alpha [Acidobacteria bacterium]|nr:exodeoxyribonuclease V subunit alpha [Acidobacteriota bacterium]HNU02183.1 exodeoxyribonuclease V subunit alpha [Acidobacteriota bacterium]